MFVIHMKHKQVNYVLERKAGCMRKWGVLSKLLCAKNEILAFKKLDFPKEVFSFFSGFGAQLCFGFKNTYTSGTQLFQYWISKVSFIYLLTLWKYEQNQIQIHASLFFPKSVYAFWNSNSTIVMLSLCSKSIIEFIHPWHVDWEVAGRWRLVFGTK